MRLRLPATVESVPLAREALAPLRGALDTPTFDDLRLLVSETVTNAVRHAGAGREAPEVELVLETAPDHLRVTVFDDGPGFAPQPVDRADLGSGWGLRLLDRVSRAWGTGTEPRAHVWFELGLAGESTSTAP